MDWFAYDFDHPAYFDHYRDKEGDAAHEGPALAALLGLEAGALVLDLPCGWGRLRPALEARGHEVIGGDLSALNLRRHRVEHPGAILRLDFRALPFRAACADGVFCAFTSWGYFATEEENLRQLQEFARVLRPGGTLLLDLCGRESLERGVASCEGRWVELKDLGYRERVRWSPDRKRIWTERKQGGCSFRHDIWIPTDVEVRNFLEAAGFDLEDAFGGLHGGPWTYDADRWIYRALKPRLSSSPG
ncbi:MAG: class I SAM-dependent methyltransferase [Holophagaceae bacterium]|nr:class I SAM-dependent methyltransferase [Holophagaceae bacterium]